MCDCVWDPCIITDSLSFLFRQYQLEITWHCFKHTPYSWMLRQAHWVTVYPPNQLPKLVLLFRLRGAAHCYTATRPPGRSWEGCVWEPLLQCLGNLFTDAEGSENQKTNVILQ